ncbi:oxygenase [Lithospermum erythrorhizon]|uniref:Oxygenase n=1 Tax=Lithospermum erythrorhizon TaxID=34254 RepID=A0AAV3RRI3_LITER
MASIPIIDLNDENAPELILHACKTWGFFQVVNHNIKESLIDEMEAAAKDLFALPMEQKLKAEKPPGDIAGYGVPPVCLSHPKRWWTEGFFIAGSPLEHARLLWPRGHKTFCDVVEEYQKEMNTLALRLFWLMLGSHGITKDDIKWAEIKSPYLQLNSYPACPDPSRASGLPDHTDSGVLTILYQNTSGLQVHKEGFGWVDVPPVPGALVVNIGDLFQVLSNDLFPSVFHRATANPTQYRVTLAYFFGPPLDVEVSPLAKLVDNSYPALYKPISWIGYRAIKVKDYGRAISKVRVCTQASENVDTDDDPNSA